MDPLTHQSHQRVYLLDPKEVHLLVRNIGLPKVLHPLLEVQVQYLELLWKKRLIMNLNPSIKRSNKRFRMNWRSLMVRMLCQNSIGNVQLWFLSELFCRLTDALLKYFFYFRVSTIPKVPSLPPIPDLPNLPSVPSATYVPRSQCPESERSKSRSRSRHSSTYKSRSESRSRSKSSFRSGSGSRSSSSSSSRSNSRSRSKSRTKEEADNSIEILDESDQETTKRPVKLSFESQDEDGGHTCVINANNICQKCFQYKFSGSRANVAPQRIKIGGILTATFHLDMSLEEVEYLKTKMPAMKIFCTKTNPFYKLLTKEITFRGATANIQYLKRTEHKRYLQIGYFEF